MLAIPQLTAELFREGSEDFYTGRVAFRANADAEQNYLIPPILARNSRHLRKNSTLAEVLRWEEIKDRMLSFYFS